MIDLALQDLIYSLQQIKGGRPASALFPKVLEQLKSTGLLVPDDELYDDRDGQRDGRKGTQDVPQHSAAGGLGPAGRVSVAPSIWNSVLCVPSDLIHRYRPFAHSCARTRLHPVNHKKAHALHAMYHRLHRVTKGLRRTFRRATTSDFCGPKMRTSADVFLML